MKHSTEDIHTYLNTIRITLDDILLNHLLAAILRMEHKCTDSMTKDEYWAAVALANDCNAPDFITDYFRTKAGKL